MSGTADYLGRFLAHSRAVGLARMFRTALVDGMLVLGGTALGAGAITAWTLRGDLAGPWALGVATAGLAVRFALLRRRMAAAYGPARAAGLPTARTIARTPGPLRRRGADAAAEVPLRHEILGATELRGGATRNDSTSLASHYVREVGRRLEEIGADPGLAVPPPRWLWRVRLGAVLAALSVVAAGSPAMSRGFELLVAGEDGRPPPPREPVWNSLELSVAYPAYTARPARTVQNPSGALRAPAGTEVTVSMSPRHDADAGAIVVTHDATELAEAPPPEVTPLTDLGDGRLEGTFRIRAPGTWTLVLLDDPDDEVQDASHRSEAFPLQLEADRPPEVELLPLPASQRQVTDTDRVQIRFRARDDFGITGAELVYQLPEGDSHSIPLGTAPDDGRSWKGRHDWDLSSIPLEARGEVLYWIEVRDNDPGLGLAPLPDPPGKLARSATMRLLVKDEEAEHARNIAALRELRDAAVDLLAARLTTTAFSGGGSGLTPRIRAAREILQMDGNLLQRLVAAADALAVDALARERHAELLAAIHGRLAELHRAEQGLHERLPPGIEQQDPGSVPDALARLGRHNGRSIGQLEDEIIRIDDLVDEQLLERLEALLARLRTTQQKLVELLEQLKAGDESVRPMIDQLEQRRREDLRRIAELRAQLRKEVGDDFMNRDAFDVLRRMQESQSRNLDDRLQAERDQLRELQGLHDQVQGQLGQDGARSELSDEERARMKLLRELSRLQDEQTSLRSETRRVDEAWRAAVGEQPATSRDANATSKAAESMRRAVERINDARLGRDARRGLEDADDALERLATLAEKPNVRQLELAEAARQAADGVRRAAAGSRATEEEGKQVRSLVKRADALDRKLSASLPPASDVLGPEIGSKLSELRDRQLGLHQRSAELLGSPSADPLPDEGRTAMKDAHRGMERGGDSLDAGRPGPAIRGQNGAWSGLQRAIDSLRRGSPPPQAAPVGEASTEAEQDRSLREQLLEAMREGVPPGYDESVTRYYEELLR